MDGIILCFTTSNNKHQREMKGKDEALHIPDVGKRKYWYRTDIYGCVLCGKEKIDRQRVYDEDKKGTHWHDDACSGHF